MIRLRILACWKRYKRSSKPFRRRVGLWFGLLGGKFVGCHNFETFKRVCLDLAQHEQHTAFACVVRWYDPDLRLPVHRAAFMSAGAAHGSLNAFRLFSGPYRAFEKIYRNDAIEWARCRFFYEAVLPMLDESLLKVPSLLAQGEGRRLLFAHFELVRIDPLSRQGYLKLACRVISLLRSVPVSIRLDDQWLGGWQDTPFFTAQVAKTWKLLESEGVSVVPLERSMRAAVLLPRFAAHGDLSKSNLGAGNLVLDWDCFGYFPAEYDVALVVALCIDSDGELSQELESFISASYAGLDAVTSLMGYRYHVYLLALIMADRKDTKLVLYDRLFRSAA